MLPDILHKDKVFTAISLRLLAVITVFLILWDSSNPPGLLFYVILGILVLSNIALFVFSKEVPARTVLRYFLIGDGIALPVAALGANCAATQVQIVFVVAVLVASVSTWAPASLISFAVAAGINTIFTFTDRAGFSAGSYEYHAWLLTHFCVASLGVHVSAWFGKEEKRAAAMSEEVRKRESMVSGAAETIAHWLNIYETAVRNIPSGVVLFDKELRLVLVNDAFSQIVGQEPSEMVNRTPSQYFPEKVINELGLRKKLEKVKNTGELIEPQELEIFRPGRRSHTVIFKAFPIYDQAGDIKFVLAVFDEVTELRKVDRQRVESEQHYRSLFMNIPDAVAVFSMAGGAPLIHNQQFQDLTGYSPNELRDKSYSDFFPTQKLQGVVRKYIYQAGEDANLSSPIELEMVVSNGDALDVEVVFEPYFVEDKPLGIQVIIRDVTARKTAEAEAVKRKVQARLALKQLVEEKKVAEELRKLDTLKSEFVSMASHELRTPMASIKGALSLLDEEASKPLDETQRKWVDMALRNVDRLTTLLNDTLDVAKIEAGKFPLHPKEIDISSLAGQITEEYSIKAAETGHVIQFETPDSNVRAYVDAEACRRIVINLLGNAIFHTEPNTKIVLRTIADDGISRIEVQDNGKGIEAENLTRIFERFYQADRKTGEGPKGTGLGLPICKGLVEQMGGKIWAESKPGKGATFIVTLPAHKG